LFAQQLENPGFEDWEDVGLGLDNLEPVNWSTIKTSDDPNLSGFAAVTWERTTESHSGQYAVKLFNTTQISIPVVGTVCNGRYHPNINTALAYSYTDTEDPRWNTPFTSRPDSIAFWVKFFPMEGDTMQFQALLHVGACSLPPNFINPENQVGYTRADLPGPYEDWTRISLAFEYSDGRIPEYILIILASGNGTNSIDGSIAYFDDLEIIEPQAVKDNPLSNAAIYIANEILYLKNVPNDYLNDAKIKISDLTGRTLLQSNIYSSELSLKSINLNTGCYIVSIASAEHTVSKKLFID